MTTASNVVEHRKAGLVTKFADRYSVDASKLMDTLKATAFKQRDGTAPSNEQMMALLVVADQYHLNPFTREIYAFPDKQNGIVPVVGVDGWSRIINTNPEFDGMEYRYSDEMVTPPGAASKCHEWCEVIIYRRDRKHPVVVREYLDEVYREPFVKNGHPIKGPWQTHPKRFLRHKTTIQGARLAFGFVGIFDQDEAERIAEQEPRDITPREQPRPEGRPERQPYSPESYAANINAWRGLIETGRKSADEIIAMVESKGYLTDEQKAEIRAFEPESVEGEIVE